MSALSISDCLQKKARTLGFWAGVMLFLCNSSVLLSQNNVSFEAAISTKEVVVGLPFELTFTLKNAEGRVVQWFGTNTDVNEQRLGEKARRETEKRLEVVMGNMSEGLVISDLAGQPLHWNPLLFQQLPL